MISIWTAMPVPPRNSVAHFNPFLCLAARQFRFENLKLTKTVGKQRVLGGNGMIFHREVKAPEDLFECVIVTFAVASREIRVFRGVLPHEGRIF